MKLEKRGNKWSFRYSDNGEQKRKTIEAYTFKDAQRLQVEFLSSIKGKSSKLIDVKLQAFIKEYLSYSETNKRPRSYRIDKYALTNLFDYIKVANIKDFTPRHIEEYKTERAKKIKPVSVNREIQTIKAMFNKAVEWKYLSESPAKSVKYIKQSVKPPRFLSKEEIKALLEAASGYQKDMIMIALYTGFRISEVLNLQWSDVDFTKNLISVNPKHDFTPKDYEFRAIPINAQLKAYLLKLKLSEAKDSDYIVPKTIIPNTIWVAFNKLFKKAGIKTASFHTLRHTFASHLVISGISLYTVSQLLGHSKIETTMIYAHLSKDHLKHSVDILNFGQVLV